MNKKFLIVFSALLFAGCTTVPLKNNILAIDRDGEAEIPGHTLFGTEKIKETQSEDEYITLLLNPDKDNIEYKDKNNVANLNKPDKNKIVVYIHGGLNWPSESVTKANDLTPIIEESGYTPLFIDWRSGLYSTYTEHLLFDRQGEYFNLWGPITAPFILLEDIGRGLTRAPMLLFQIANNYGKSIFFGGYGGEKNAHKLNGYFTCSESPDKLCNSSNNFGFGEFPKLYDVRSSNDKVKNGAIDFVNMGNALVTAPVFDVLATSAWSTMKRRTEIMFTKRICYDSDKDCNKDKDKDKDKDNSPQEYQQNRTGAATKFFNDLRDKQKANKDLEIILVGHSMGAIVANKVLSNWPDINFSKVIYLAAACSIEDFKLSVLPYMKEHNRTIFYNLTLHPIAENTESHLWGFGQTGSLLTQIDNFYESPIYENKRTLGRWTNVMNNIEYSNEKNTATEKTNNNCHDIKQTFSNSDTTFDDIKPRLYFRTMPIGSRFPENHGDFNEVKFIFGAGKFWTGELGDQGHLIYNSVTCAK
jgi:hypothetical protein